MSLRELEKPVKVDPEGRTPQRGRLGAAKGAVILQFTCRSQRKRNNAP